MLHIEYADSQMLIFVSNNCYSLYYVCEFYIEVEWLFSLNLLFLINSSVEVTVNEVLHAVKTMSSTQNGSVGINSISAAGVMDI